MSQHTSLPMQSLSVDEKHDPYAGHSAGNGSARVGNGVGAGSSNGGSGSNGGVLPGANMNRKNEKKVHPAVIITLWIFISMSVIIYNAYILKPESQHGLGFKYPIFLTTFHMCFSTVGTRVLARYTHMLDGLANVEMTNERWVRNILPIGLLFSASLALSNYAYLYLSVAYIQMIKAFMPVATLFMSVAFGLRSANSTQLAIISLISFGVALASYGELNFSLIGFIFQATAILFESTRLVMIQVLLQGLKMDPLVSLYYFAPVCAAILAIALPFTEGIQPFFELQRLGAFVLLSNASCAFALNIAAVMLIGAASSLVLTLAGVIKDILLIAGSCVILATQISGLQYIGYSFSLTGLVLYKRYGN